MGRQVKTGKQQRGDRDCLSSSCHVSSFRVLNLNIDNPGSTAVDGQLNLPRATQAMFACPANVQQLGVLVIPREEAAATKDV